MEVWRHEIMSVHSFSQQMHMRKRRLFCASMHQHVPYGEEHDLNDGSAPSNNCFCKGAWAIVKYAVPKPTSMHHMEEITRMLCYIYVETAYSSIELSG